MCSVVFNKKQSVGELKAFYEKELGVEFKEFHFARFDILGMNAKAQCVPHTKSIMS